MSNQNATIPFCPVHQNGQEIPEYLHQLDPRNYKFLPHKFTEIIRPAGRFTHKSENISNLLRQE